MRLLAIFPFVAVLGAACGGTDSIGNEPPPADNDAQAADAPAPGTDAATGCTCVAPAPSGWAYVEYTASTRPACPADFASPVDTLEGYKADPATCTCGCSGFSSGPSCSPQTVYLSSGPDNACKGGNTSLTPSSSCNAQTYTDNTATQVRLSGGTPTKAGSCQAPSASPTTPPPTIDNQGRACGRTSKNTGSCSGGQLCLSSAPAPFSLCVEQAGDAACPSGFPNKHTTGSGLNDTRSCDGSACTCTANITCNTPTFNFYSDSSCSKWLVFGSVPADSSCNLELKSPPMSFGSFSATSSVNTSSCDASGTASPTGGVSLAGAETICCK